MSNKFSTHGNFSFSELRSKEVVNSLDGRRLGRIIDLVFGSRDGRIMGLVLPHSRKNIIFRNSEPIFIPWSFVERIGEDIIMIRLAQDYNRIVAKRPHSMRDNFAKIAEYDEPIVAARPDSITKKSAKLENAKELKKPNCDGQCEKCMLFDCEYRWRHDEGAHIHQNENEQERDGDFSNFDY